MRNRMRRFAVAMLLLLGVTLATPLAPASAATTVNGSLSCVTGAPVVGVWVAADTSNDGWASFSQDGSTFRWSYTLNAGGSYHINVGCGGQPGNWASSNSSDTFSSGMGFRTCYNTTYQVPANKQWRCK